MKERKMQEQNRTKKNHWTQAKIDSANKKINQDIYERNRQAPIHLNEPSLEFTFKFKEKFKIATYTRLFDINIQK